MIVTDLKYFLEDKIIKKLDLMIKRCEQSNPKKDALLIIEGAEGEGKSNTSCANAYYIKSKTKRDIHLFFKLDELIRFAQSTEAKIIIWDEPALDSLSTDWYKETNKNLIRLLMVARKKRHFFMFNLTKFYKFSDYIVVDRGLGMIHMYSRMEIEPGRFVYIRKKNLERLYLGWRQSKKRLYKKFTSFRGSYPEVLEKHFDKMGIYINGKIATYSDYDKEKDRAIESIGNNKSKEPKDNGLIELRIKVGSLKFPIKTQIEFANRLNVNRRTLTVWKNLKNHGDNSLFPKELGLGNG